MFIIIDTPTALVWGHTLKSVRDQSDGSMEFFLCILL